MKKLSALLIFTIFFVSGCAFCERVWDFVAQTPAYQDEVGEAFGDAATNPANPFAWLRVAAVVTTLIGAGAGAKWATNKYKKKATL